MFPLTSSERPLRGRSPRYGSGRPGAGISAAVTTRGGTARGRRATGSGGCEGDNLGRGRDEKGFYAICTGSRGGSRRRPARDARGEGEGAAGTTGAGGGGGRRCRDGDPGRGRRRRGRRHGGGPQLALLCQGVGEQGRVQQQQRRGRRRRSVGGGRWGVRGRGGGVGEGQVAVPSRPPGGRQESAGFERRSAPGRQRVSLAAAVMGAMGVAGAAGVIGRRNHTGAQWSGACDSRRRRG